MNKHTPGPWKVVPGEFHMTVETEDGVLVAECNFAPDARLMAKAPEMMAMLKQMQTDMRVASYQASTTLGRSRAPSAKMRALDELLDSLGEQS